MQTAFITGITGQDGAYLARFLLQKGYAVHGGVRPNIGPNIGSSVGRNSPPTTTRLDLLGITDQITLHDFELTDQNNILRVIRDVQMDEFYNLAAQSFVGTSWDQPVYTADADAMAVVRILDALRDLRPDVRFYQASSSEMFGQACEMPQRETTAFNPRSPYGAAKAFGHYITVNYRQSFGMHANSGILFNHESPLRGKEFVTRKITMDLAARLHGSDRPVQLGNMNARRDWGFAGDYVEGMWRMLQQDTPDDYVLATGITTSIRDFFSAASQALDIDLEWVGEGANEMALDRKSGQQLMRVNPQFYRPAEVDVLTGDSSKAQQNLGWAPRVDIGALAQMMARSDYNALV